MWEKKLSETVEGIIFPRLLQIEQVKAYVFKQQMLYCIFLLLYSGLKIDNVYQSVNYKIIFEETMILFILYRI